MPDLTKAVSTVENIVRRYLADGHPAYGKSMTAGIESGSEVIVEFALL